MDELFEILTWNQLKIHSKKIYILNSEGFYNHLHKHLQLMAREGFLQTELQEFIHFCATPIELFNKIS
jgi:predicted Rossmann-fold nucleotide-binding protein